MRRWQYGAYLRVSITHPVIHQIPMIGKYFDIGPAPMSGSSTTVKQTTRSLAPSMRMNADLGDWDRSLLNVQIGQSGQVLSATTGTSGRIITTGEATRCSSARCRRRARWSSGRQTRQAE